MHQGKLPFKNNKLFTSIRELNICNWCGGDGKCRICNGTGYSAQGSMPNYECPTCKREKHPGDCPGCHGKGTL